MDDPQDTSDRPRRSLLADRSSDPFAAMRRLSDEMHQWFNSSQFGRPAFSAQAPHGQTGTWMPQIETIQRGDQFIVRADLPGLAREDVTIEMEDGALTIAGERQQERETEEDGYVSTERSYGRFTRVVPLPDGVIAESATATFRNGVLEISMPCAPRPISRGRTIEIRD